jgi:enamine deaminase RidA (YjgF/YER057c/UK114 family)
MGHSRAVIDNNYVFVSGYIGFDYQAMSISNDILEQAEQCFQNIELALEQAGKAIDQVLSVCYIFPNRADFELCWPILDKYFGNVRPAAIMIVAGLFD